MHHEEGKTIMHLHKKKTLSNPINFNPKNLKTFEKASDLEILFYEQVSRLKPKYSVCDTFHIF